MKRPFSLFFLLFCIIELNASPDSLFSVANLQNLSDSERLLAIESAQKKCSEEEKQSFLEHLIQISEQENWLSILAKGETDLGLYHYRRGDYPEALNHYQKALVAYEKVSDGSGQGQVYNLLVTLSKKQKDYQRAHEYLDKTMEVCSQINDSSCLSTVFDNRGLVYSEQKDFKKAKAQYLIALGIRKRLKDTVGLAYVYSNLAEVASNEGLFEQAEAYLLQSSEYRILSKDLFGEAVNYTNLGELYFKQNKYKQAAKYFEQSLDLSRQLGISDLSQWNYRYLSRSFSALGKTEKALAFLNQSYQLKDSLLTVEKLRQITEMETRFDTERKEQQIKLQDLEIENQIQRNRNQLLMAGGILALLALGFSIFFINYRNRQKNQLQENQLAYQRQLLNTTIETQEKERLRISKDLHDGIGQQLSGLKMAWQELRENLKSLAPEESERLEGLSQVLGGAADEVRSISHQMMPLALQRYGLLAASEDLMEKTFKNTSFHFDFEHFGVEERFAQNIELSTYRILQELINNIIKHSQATEVSVQLMKSKNKLIMVVEDNGIGLKEELLSNGGHGMKNMQSRAQLVNGNLSFEKASPGTIATLRIALVMGQK